MDVARIPVSATAVEPPTLDELRAKLAQLEIDAQRAELQRHIRELSNAATERNAKAA